MLARFHDWEKRLREFSESKRTEPFSYGLNDCCLFACDGVTAITGVDLARDIRGYIGEEEAAAVLDEFGGVGGVAEFMAQQHEIVEVPVKRAKRGDVVLCEWDGKEILCLIDCSSAPAMPGDTRMTHLPRGSMKRAWSIG